MRTCSKARHGMCSLHSASTGQSHSALVKALAYCTWLTFAQSFSQPSLLLTVPLLQTAVFSPAVHDSDVSSTTFTADTNTVTDTLAFATAMAQIADDTKGQDLMLLHVEPLSSWTSYMLLVTVSSRPQLNAVLARIEKEAESTAWGRPRTHQSPGGYDCQLLVGFLIAYVELHVQASIKAAGCLLDIVKASHTSKPRRVFFS